MHTAARVLFYIEKVMKPFARVILQNLLSYLVTVLSVLNRQTISCGRLSMVYGRISIIMTASQM